MGGGGSGMMITTPEIIKFVDVAVPLVGSSHAPEEAKLNEKAKRKVDESLAGGTYEVTLPYLAPGLILPTFARRSDDIAGVQVSYSFELLGERPGLFKSNDK